MQAFEIVTDTLHANEASDLEAVTPEEEFEAEQGELVAIEEYNSDRGVL